MKKIMDKLTELVGIAEVRIKKCDQEKEQNAQLKSSLNNREIEINKKEEELNLREKKITICEDLDKAKDEITVLAKQVKQDARALKDKKSLLDEANDKKQKELHEEKLRLEQKDAKLRKQSLELEEEKKKYKQTILDEIDRKMGGGK